MGKMGQKEEKEDGLSLAEATEHAKEQGGERLVALQSSINLPAVTSAHSGILIALLTVPPSASSVTPGESSIESNFQS